MAKEKRRLRESNILDDLEAFLKLAKIRLRRQEYCGYMGYADLVTDCCLYEAKLTLTSNNLKAAVGQAIIYRSYIDKALLPVIVGGIAKWTNEAVPFIVNAGVAVLGWRPMQDNLFTSNLGLLEGIDRDQFKEINDQILWKMDDLDWPPITQRLRWAISAIERPMNCPLVRKAKGDVDRALIKRIAFRESRHHRPHKQPRPLAGLPNPTRIQDDAEW